MTQEEYLLRLRNDPWTFPKVDGELPPADWVNTAWEDADIREPVVADLRREVSKTGELNCPDEWLRGLAESPSYAISELYRLIREDSPHREAEFRPQFERVLGADSPHLSKPLSQLRVMRLLGPSLAELLLQDEYADAVERTLFLKIMPRMCDMFLEVDPPGFQPPTDDEYDRAVEHVVAGIPGCQSREELRSLIREGFRKDWIWWAPWPPGVEAETKFDRLADEIWRLWNDIKQQESSS